jgi:hypothetical protein
MRLKELTIKVGKTTKKLPIFFGFNTQADFCDDLGIAIEDYDNRVGGSEMRLGDIRALAWHAFKNGHRRHALSKDAFTLTKEQVGDMFDDNPTLITDIFNAIVEAQPKGGEDSGNVTEG